MLDRDPEAIAAAQGLMAQDPRVKAMKTPFGELESALAEGSVARQGGRHIVRSWCVFATAGRSRAGIQFHERWSARYEDGQ